MPFETKGNRRGQKRRTWTASFDRR